MINNMICKMISFFVLISVIAYLGVIVYADQPQALNIEKVVTLVLKNNENILMAQNDLRLRELDLKKLNIANQFSITTNYGIQIKDTSSESNQDINLNLPVMSQLSLEANLPVNIAWALKLNYQPFAGNETQVNSQTAFNIQLLNYRKIVLDTELDVRQKYIYTLMNIKRTGLAKAQLDLTRRILDKIKEDKDSETSDRMLIIAHRDFLYAQIALKEAQKNEAESRSDLSQACRENLENIEFIDLPDINIDDLQITNLKQQLGVLDIEQNIDVKTMYFQLQNEQYIYQRIKRILPPLTISVTVPTDTMQYCVEAQLTWTIKKADKIEAEKQLLQIKNFEQRIEMYKHELLNKKDRLMKDLEIQTLTLSRAILEKKLMEYTLSDFKKQFELGQISSNDLERFQCQMFDAEIINDAKYNLWSTIFNVKQFLMSQ